MPKIVPPCGPRDAKIALVGEAPARLETIQGKPFVGPAGAQLDLMLNAAGIPRSTVYITNVVKHEVPQGDEKSNWFFKKGSPTSEYMDAIIALIQELQELKPNVVVPLGNYALWALTQQQEIAQRRGSILESTMIPGLKVIPTYHPAFYIHEGHFNSPKEALGIWDLTRVKEQAAFPEIRQPQARFILNPTPDEIEWAIRELLAGDHITVDTEWFGPENLAYIGFTNSPEWAICIPATSLQAYRAYKTLLSSDITKIIQNAAFDDLALFRQGIKIAGPVDDTMVAWHSCWGDIGEKRLGTISSVMTEWPFYKDELEYVDKGDPRGQEYNCKDCVVTDESWVKLDREDLDYTGGRGGYAISKALGPIMREAARKGVLADTSVMDLMASEHLTTADELERILSETIGHTLNCRSGQQVIRLVFDELGYGKKRKVRTSKQEVLMDIAASESDETKQAVLTAVIRVRQNRNIVSRYLNVDAAVDKDGRIRTNWNLAGTRGGARLSATIFGRGEQRWFPSVPMQTIPEPARICYIADPGCVFLGWDLEQAEARVVAVKTHDFELLEDMERGIDIHTKLAAMLPFGLTYEEIIRRCQEAEAQRKSKDTVAERYLAKKCRHGLNYVMGAGTFKSSVNKEWLETGIGLTEGKAEELRKAYLKLHPGLEIWWDEVKALAFRNPRVIRTFHGRQKQFLGHFTNDMHREMVSFEPQALVADTVSLGMIEATALIRRLDPDFQFFCHMHDGGFAQVREGVALEAAAILHRCMVREMIVNRQPLSIPCTIKIGPNWGQLEKVRL